MNIDEEKAQKIQDSLSSFIFKLIAGVVLFLFLQLILTTLRYVYQAEYRVEGELVRRILYLMIFGVGVGTVVLYLLNGYSTRDSKSEAFSHKNEYLLFVVPISIIFNYCLVSPSPMWSGELMSDLFDLSFLFSFVLLSIFMCNLAQRAAFKIEKRRLTALKEEKNHKNHYHADRELASDEEDLLKRTDFAKDLVTAIVEQGAQNLTIGILGEWGSGKSSVYTLMKKILKNPENFQKNNTEKPNKKDADKSRENGVEKSTEERSEKSKENDKLKKEVTEKYKDYVIMDFKPWYFGADNHEIIRTYLFQLMDVIKQDSGFDPLLDKKLRQYASYVSALNLRTGGFIFSFKDFLEKYMPSKDSLKISDIKKEIETLLQESTKSIIVFIDDIDRLARDEIKMVFKLIRLVADFPKITYVLALDEKVVAASLADSDDEKSLEMGKKYLDKFIQLPIYLPKAEQLRVNDMVWKRLPEELTQGGLQKDELFQHMGMLEITPREATRFVNLVSFFLPILREEVNVKDLAYLLLIQIKSPELYTFISENRSNLVESDWERNKQGATKWDDQSIEHFQRNIPDFKKYQDILTHLFQKAVYLYDKNKKIQTITKKALDQEKRISSSTYFSQYFKYGLPDDEVSQKIIEEILVELKKQELSETQKYESYNKLNKFDVGNVYNKLRSRIGSVQEYLKLTMTHMAMYHYEEIDSEDDKEYVKIFLREAFSSLEQKTGLQKIFEQDWSLGLMCFAYDFLKTKDTDATVLRELSTKIKYLYREQTSSSFFEKTSPEEAEKLLMSWFEFEDSNFIKRTVSGWLRNEENALESFLSIRFSGTVDLLSRISPQGLDEAVVNRFVNVTKYMDDDFLETVFKSKDFKTLEELIDSKEINSSLNTDIFFYTKNKIYDYVYTGLVEVIELSKDQGARVKLKSSFDDLIALILKFGETDEIKEINRLLQDIQTHNEEYDLWLKNYRKMINEQRGSKNQES